MSGPIATLTQQASPVQDSMIESLDMAKKLMTSKRSKSAIAITSRLMEQLKERGEYDTPFGLDVRLAHGSALIHADTSSSSYDFLWELKTNSKAKEQWDIFAETCRVIASLLEYAGRKEESLANLREAQTTIKQHQLDSIYPYFAVRISSWHRIFGDRDSSIFYANEAIRTAPDFGKVFEAAAGHLLLGLNYSKIDPRNAIFHFRVGAQLYREVEEFTSYCSMYLNIVKLQLAQGTPREAIASLDSAILYFPQLKENNIDQGQTARIYNFKGEAFQQLGQLDSAIFYLKKGHSMELEYLVTINNDKIVEIDNKFNVDLKGRELEAKSIDLQLEKERRNWLVISTFLLVLFAAALAYYYVQLRKANRKTNIQSEQLKILDVAKSRFFANISHELRTPLTLVLGPIASLIKENHLTEKQCQLLKIATRSGRQLEQLITEILDLGKLEFGKMEVQAKPTVLVPFFRNYLLQFESLAVRKQIRFEFNFDVPDDLTAQIDQSKCRQILYNLLSNAFKFTPMGGQVTVKFRLENGKIEQYGNNISQFPNFIISISDTGPGIHPDDLPHVFDRYFQTNRPEAPASGGTGIGLALSWEYVQLFGGKIEVGSTLGKGSNFLVTFPLDVVKVKINQQKQENLRGKLVTHYRPATEKPDRFLEFGTATPLTFDTSKATILVVEDNSELQDYIRLILQSIYNIVTAENGQAALQWLTVADRPSSTIHRPPSLILSDLMMPVMDGYQLLEKLKSEEPTRHIPVIMLTARAEARDRLKALRIGVDDYLTKPFDEEELKVRIENLLANYAVRKELATESEPSPVTTIPSISQPDQVWLETFETYVQKNLSNNSTGVSMLAYQFAMSESTLLRQLKRLTGLSPVQYLLEMRLNVARQLLEDRTYDSIAKVASEVGYNDPRFFSRSFRKRFGKPPSAFLNN